MKRFRIILLALLLCAGCVLAAQAETGVDVEVIKVDGVSVMVFTSLDNGAKGGSESGARLTLPSGLLTIEEESFAGIGAETVEVSTHVKAIKANAFANCPNLRSIYIPETVKEIDKDALAGCEKVTVYGKEGSAAQAFAKNAGFEFVVYPAETHTGYQQDAPAVELPRVPR